MLEGKALALWSRAFGIGGVLMPNMALNLAPLGRWTLRDKPAQRRLALR